MSITKDALRKLTRDPPNIVYHYCGPDGLLGIVKGRQIWATSMRHLNDTSEQIYAAEQIHALVRRIARETSADPAALPATRLIERAGEVVSYVACFSEHDDLLSQWRAYTPPRAVSHLEFRLLRYHLQATGFLDNASMSVQAAIQPSSRSFVTTRSSWPMGSPSND
jgi:hypothetical protein